jgi:hypothetical protein
VNICLMTCPCDVSGVLLPHHFDLCRIRRNLSLVVQCELYVAVTAMHWLPARVRADACCTPTCGGLRDQWRCRTQQRNETVKRSLSMYQSLCHQRICFEHDSVCLRCASPRRCRHRLDTANLSPRLVRRFRVISDTFAPICLLCTFNFHTCGMLRLSSV